MENVFITMILLCFGGVILGGLGALVYFIKEKEYGLAAIGVTLYIGLIGCIGLICCK